MSAIIAQSGGEAQSEEQSCTMEADLLELKAGIPFCGPLAQLVEQWTFNPLVTGSNPVRPTKKPTNCVHQPADLYRLDRSQHFRVNQSCQSIGIVGEIFGQAAANAPYLSISPAPVKFLIYSNLVSPLIMSTRII
jgi:hypothetical protein